VEIKQSGKMEIKQSGKIKRRYYQPFRGLNLIIHTKKNMKLDTHSVFGGLVPVLITWVNIRRGMGKNASTEQVNLHESASSRLLQLDKVHTTM
jgi:hypothetical protein